MTTHPEHTHLTGRRKLIVQAIWLVLVGILVGTFALGVPIRWRFLKGETQALLVPTLPPEMEVAGTSRPGPQELQALAELGLSPDFYAVYILFFEVALALVCTLIGLFIFLRRHDDWMALFFSLILVLLGTNSVSVVVPSLALIAPGWGLVATIAGLVGMTTNVYILFLAPDGRFVPRWTRTLAVGFTIFMVALLLYVLVVPETWQSIPPIAVAMVPWVPLIGVGIWSQIYRYRHVSDPTQRQQTKWIVVGLAVITVGFVMNGLFQIAAYQNSGVQRVLLHMLRAPVVHLLMMLLPLCIAFSILRYRLWDIDLIIRRTLTYALVTALLAVVFFGSVFFLQQLFARLTGSEQDEIVTVLSTLTIAALFGRVRIWIQNVIDRRFNRTKYDAQQILQKFGERVRDETDLENLTSDLVQVIQETMQPKSVSVWLKPESGRTPRV